MRLLISTGIILISFSTVSISAIYEWTNKQGHTAYTQAPPKDKSISSKKLVVKSQTISESTSNVESSSNDLEVSNEDDSSASTPDEAKKIAEGKKLLKEQCINAKSALAGLEGGNRLYKDSKGNYLRMTEEEKNKRRKNINEFMSEHCK